MESKRLELAQLLQNIIDFPGGNIFWTHKVLNVFITVTRYFRKTMTAKIAGYRLLKKKNRCISEDTRQISELANKIQHSHN